MKGRLSMTQNRKQKTKEERDQEIKFNKHCGTRLRNIRCKNGYSQTNVADELNVSFQQIQKYEKGFNGLTYEKSCKLAKFFNVDVNYFADGFNLDNYTSNLKYEDRFPEINRCNQVRNERLYPNPNSYGDVSDHLNNISNEEILKIGQ
jgi:transcriptional regulator with XRE-family HTH domain